MEKKTLNKTERLKSRKLIGSLFEKGKRLYAHPLKMVYLINNIEEADSLIKFAVTVPKKKFPLAVDRNLIKRRIREAYRNNKHELNTLISDQEGRFQVSFMFIQASDYIEEYSAIEKNVVILLQKLQRRLEKEKASM